MEAPLPGVKNEGRTIKMKKRVLMLAVTLAVILLCGNAMAEISGGGLLATADANGVITLTGDVALSSTVSFEAGKTYTIKGNGHKLTHGASYTGTLFTVPQNTTLTIENLVIDGGNAWTLDETKWAAAKARSDSRKDGTVAEVQEMVTSNGLNASSSLFNVKGSVTLKDTTVQNVYTSNNIKLFSMSSGGSVTLGNGTIIQHCATVGCANNGFVSSYSSSEFTLENGAVIQDMLGDCNGGLFALWGGNAKLTMNGGAIRNIKTIDSNGSVVMMHSGNTFTMNGGVIENVQGLYRINNGRLGIIYLHTGSNTFIMNGGAIQNNLIGGAGVVDANRFTAGRVELNAGTIQNNTTGMNNSTAYVARVVCPTVVGRDMKIDKPITVSDIGVLTDEGDNHQQYLLAKAKNGNQYYGLLNVAIDNAKEGDTLQLLRDSQTNPFTLTDKEIILDLNGKTITAKNEDQALGVIDGGILYVTDTTRGGVTGQGGAAEAQAGYPGGGWLKNQKGVAVLKNGGQLILFSAPAPEVAAPAAPSANVPQTGDTTPLALLFAALALSGAGLLGLRKKARAR